MPVIDPARFDAVLADLDGVVTDTARVHATAWQRLFDDYLKQRAATGGEKFVPFDIVADYRRYVDGKPRYAGVESFLASRGIELPQGSPEDPPDRETVCGLGNRKNQHFQAELEAHGADVYETTVRWLHDAIDRGLRLAVVSSSRNCGPVLESVGLAHLFEIRVDGLEAGRLGLKGKLDPDMFLEAARRLGVSAERSIVLEDAESGVEAGRRGGFGLVVGIDRTGHAADLLENGADVVVADLAELSFANPGSSRSAAGSTSSALDHLAEIEKRMRGKRVAMFLDYDGTLTPIVERPEDAVMSDAMRETVHRLSSRCTVAIVSGRDRADVESMVGLDHLVYAGSHGFDIAAPDGRKIRHDAGASHDASLREAEGQLRGALDRIPGAAVEGKKYAIAVHYRRAREGAVSEIERVVDSVLSKHPDLRRTGGKKVFELRPRVDWDKGKAVLWLLEALELNGGDVLPFYLGDDETDEDAFRALRECGIGIRVGDDARATDATYVLDDTDDVRLFLDRCVEILDRTHRP